MLSDSEGIFARADAFRAQYISPFQHTEQNEATLIFMARVETFMRLIKSGHRLISRVRRLALQEEVAQVLHQFHCLTKLSFRLDEQKRAILQAVTGIVNSAREALQPIGQAFIVKNVYRAENGEL